MRAICLRISIKNSFNETTVTLHSCILPLLASLIAAWAATFDIFNQRTFTHTHAARTHAQVHMKCMQNFKEGNKKKMFIFIDISTSPLCKVVLKCADRECEKAIISSVFVELWVLLQLMKLRKKKKKNWESVGGCLASKLNKHHMHF